ncbi:unnamed protein product [Cyprideis torosa]|uniref:MOG interacting and ectopic P-granules protein 1 n=1 Tax=Cyprideis torosa TaxID=163714 RepID=A0A7R8W3X6_9CRUS|nr:unnamed protein product [Cyprideis torosa]CAG0883491.1 unnamed protein product [Cyprideis torosa]
MTSDRDVAAMEPTSNGTPPAVGPASPPSNDSSSPASPGLPTMKVNKDPASTGENLDLSIVEIPGGEDSIQELSEGDEDIMDVDDEDDDLDDEEDDDLEDEELDEMEGESGRSSSVIPLEDDSHPSSTNGNSNASVVVEEKARDLEGKESSGEGTEDEDTSEEEEEEEDEVVVVKDATGASATPTSTAVSESLRIEEAARGTSLTITRVPTSTAVTSKPAEDSDGAKTSSASVSVTSSTTTTSTADKKKSNVVVIDTESLISGRSPLSFPMSTPPSASSVAAQFKPQTSTPQAASPSPFKISNDDVLKTLYVIEAPSFITPYVYDHGSDSTLDKFIAKLKKVLDELSAGGSSEKKTEDETKKPEEEKKDKEEEEKKKEDDKKGKEGEKKGTTKASNEEEDEESEEEEEETSLQEEKQKSNAAATSVTASSTSDKDSAAISSVKSSQPKSYFEQPMGQFFMEIGTNLVQDFIQRDVLKSVKTSRTMSQGGKDKMIRTIEQGISQMEEHTAHLLLPSVRCKYCSFKSESETVVESHMEAPHMNTSSNPEYRCNYCMFRTRATQGIFTHVLTEHHVKPSMERPPAKFPCPFCHWEGNQNNKLKKHLEKCEKTFRPNDNLLPPVNFETPGKNPRIPELPMAQVKAIQQGAMVHGQGNRYHPLVTAVDVQQANARLAAVARNRLQQQQRLAQQQQQQAVYVKTPQGKIVPQPLPNGLPSRTTPNIPTNVFLRMPQGLNFPPGFLTPQQQQQFQQAAARMAQQASAATSKVSLSSSSSTASSPHVPSSLTIQTVKKKPGQQARPMPQTPSISITPLPRGSSSYPSNKPKPGVPPTHIPTAAGFATPGAKPGVQSNYVICEICDGYIKGLDDLKQHMNWVHKIKIHQKMLKCRPPLNCQKCQYRFFTDQGLERHLLGSHGLVYQWKLLQHVSRDHHYTLKPAHLSYKCTVCSANFGQYKQFETHVYTQHSQVGKNAAASGGSSGAAGGKAASSSAPSASKTGVRLGSDITVTPKGGAGKVIEEIDLVDASQGSGTKERKTEQLLGPGGSLSSTSSVSISVKRTSSTKGGDEPPSKRSKEEDKNEVAIQVKQDSGATAAEEAKDKTEAVSSPPSAPAPTPGVRSSPRKRNLTKENDEPDSESK